MIESQLNIGLLDGGKKKFSYDRFSHVNLFCSIEKAYYCSMKKQFVPIRLLAERIDEFIRHVGWIRVSK